MTRQVARRYLSLSAASIARFRGSAGITAVVPLGLALAILAIPATGRGDTLFVTNHNTTGSAAVGTIGEYTTSGATVNSSLVSGLSFPDQIAISGSDMFVVQNANNTVGEYTTSGVPVNPTLITGLSNGPHGIAVSGPNLFVSSGNQTSPGVFLPGTIGEYTTSGAAVNASLITGLTYPSHIEVYGSDLFVVSFGAGATATSGTVGEYTTSGVPVNASLITGLDHPHDVVVSGSNLFVTIASSGAAGIGTVGEYTTSGVPVNPALITGLSTPNGIALSGSNLFVANESGGTIGEYTTSGTTVNPSLITGLNQPDDVVAVPVPEPSTPLLVAAGLVVLAVRVGYR